MNAGAGPAGIRDDVMPDAPEALLAELSGIGDAVGAEHGVRMREIATELAEWIDTTRRLAEELASAQADAIVNAGMMMSELQEAHAELDEARRAAEKSDRAKSEFLAHMSHEIRTPFNGVLGMKEILLKTELDDHQRRCVAAIGDSAEALLTIINDILDFSKIEAGKLTIQPHDFAVRELIEVVVGHFSDRARAKGIELLCVIPRTVPMNCRADSGRLRQVLINLLGNALKFTNEGAVRVEVGAGSRADSGDVTMRFAVTDTGIGIPASAQRHIFDAFEQAEPTTERCFGGTGLGLAICAKLVHMMGGEIGVTSEPGNGACFWFTVPMAVVETPVPAQRLDPAAIERVAGRRILVVDDAPMNLEVLVDQLADLPLRVDCQASAELALEALRVAAGEGDPYDLALLDMQMEGMSGYDLAVRMTADPDLAPTRRLLLTSIADGISGDALRDAGIARRLAKPVRMADLQGTVVGLLDGTSQPAQVVSVKHVPVSRRFDGHVLIAEDNPVNQLVIRTMIQGFGMTCDVAPDGRAALTAWRDGEHDIILMDCQMPEMDGFEATRRIRDAEQRYGRRRIPIVAVTANAIVGDREACIDAGMDDYLSKPYTERGLVQVLGRWLGQTSSA